MENKKILMIKHSPMNLKFTNAFYLNQLDKDMKKDEVIFIDVTSRNKDIDFIKELSPFYVGPVKCDNGLTSKIFENYWQFSKVFKGEATFNQFINRRSSIEHVFACSDEDGNPTRERFRLREFGFSQTYAYRRPYSGQPLYFYYEHGGTILKLNYIESRKRIYIPEYAKLVYNSESFKKLQKLVDNGKTIALVDFDAYNFYNKDYMKLRYERDLKKYGHLKYSVKDYLNINNMNDAINFPGLIAGHGFVLKMLLQKDIEVKNGKIIDNIGVLK